MFKRYRKSVEACFSLLQQVSLNPDNEIKTAYRLQEILLLRIIQCEARIRRAKKLRESLKAKLGNRDIRLAKDEARKVKIHITELNEFTEINHKLIGVYRDIGDGIAFTYLDAFDVKPMAFKQSPGFISGKKGTRLERKVLRSAKTLIPAPAVLILNDLTNCLRYADVTIAVFGRIATMIELKSGKRKQPTERDVRQMANLTKMTDYLKTDKTDSLYGMTGEFLRVEAHSKPVRNIASLNELISKSKKDGSTFVIPEKGLAYVVIRKDGAYENAMRFLSKSQDQWTYQMVNQAKHNNIGHYPFTLLITQPSDLFDFYNGEYLILVAINTSNFQRDLKKSDLEFATLTAADWDNIELYPLHISSTKCDFKMKLSYHLVNRLFFEFLSYKWFLSENVASARKAISQGKKE